MLYRLQFVLLLLHEGHLLRKGPTPYGNIIVSYFTLVEDNLDLTQFKMHVFQHSDLLQP